MNIIIKKFGGTSVSSISRIERAISYIKKARKSGYSVVVVVSAMGQETDRLLKLTTGLDEYKKTDITKLHEVKKTTKGHFIILKKSPNINVLKKKRTKASINLFSFLKILFIPNNSICYLILSISLIFVNESFN